ncbi:MAG: glycosyltransferase family 2 protein [Chloroflexota bacterium]|jgi:glycosyltransferase involved in cell wall biosynthesis
MARPLVSVITPTWRRAELLRGCIENVREQVYRPLEHVVVSDGPDPIADELVHSMAATAPLDADPEARVRLRYAALGRNWSAYLPDSFCAAPITVGMLVATGDYQVWLADDEVMDPEHIAALVAALESTGADFAYSRVRMHAVGQTPEHGYDIGSDPPRLGQITNVLYRTTLLRYGLYPFGAGMTSDWACIERWMARGATWAYVDRVTLTHRYDH